MINIKIIEILKKDDRSIAWLERKTGISYKTLHSLINNKTNSISFTVLEKIIKTLDCDFNDIFETTE